MTQTARRLPASCALQRLTSQTLYLLSTQNQQQLTKLHLQNRLRPKIGNLVSRRDLPGPLRGPLTPSPQHPLQTTLLPHPFPPNQLPYLTLHPPTSPPLLLVIRKLPLQLLLDQLPHMAPQMCRITIHKAPEFGVPGTGANGNLHIRRSSKRNGPIGVAPHILRVAAPSHHNLPDKLY